MHGEAQDRSRPPRARENAREFASRIRDGSPFEGRYALRSGFLTKHDLWSRHRAVMPGIYARKNAVLTQAQRLQAVGLWMPAGSALAGMAAAHLHGERWVSEEAATAHVDLYASRSMRARAGIRIRRIITPLHPDRLTVVGSAAITSVARTAVDIARWEGDDEAAIVAVDSLCNSTGMPVVDVLDEAETLGGLHGLARARRLLLKCDDRADSPPETRMRLIICASPLPDPVPQLPIRDEFGTLVTTADLGYAGAKVAIFYDGDVHLDRAQRDRDYWINIELTRLGWRLLRVTAEMLSRWRALLDHLAGELRHQDALAG